MVTTGRIFRDRINKLFFSKLFFIFVCKERQKNNELFIRDPQDIIQFSKIRFLEVFKPALHCV